MILVFSLLLIDSNIGFAYMYANFVYFMFFYTEISIVILNCVFKCVYKTFFMHTYIFDISLYTICFKINCDFYKLKYLIFTKLLLRFD